LRGKETLREISGNGITVRTYCWRVFKRNVTNAAVRISVYEPNTMNPVRGKKNEKKKLEEEEEGKKKKRFNSLLFDFVAIVFL